MTINAFNLFIFLHKDSDRHNKDPSFSNYEEWKTTCGRCTCGIYVFSVSIQLKSHSSQKKNTLNAKSLNHNFSIFIWKALLNLWLHMPDCQVIIAIFKICSVWLDTCQGKHLSLIKIKIIITQIPRTKLLKVNSSIGKPYGWNGFAKDKEQL